MRAHPGHLIPAVFVVLLCLPAAGLAKAQAPTAPNVTVREDVYVTADLRPRTAAPANTVDRSGGFAPGIARPGAGITNPVPIQRPSPPYTPEAMRNRIEGAVDIEAVVQADGTVGDVRIIKSLDSDFGMDAEALKAARQWRFTAARDRNGNAVPIVVIIGFDLRLHSTLKVEGPAGAQVSTPTKASGASAVYPPSAQTAGIQGVVVVEAVTSKAGVVTSARVTQSVPGLDDAALTAARAWQYTPTFVNNVPAETLVITTFHFVITK